MEKTIKSISFSKYHLANSRIRLFRIYTLEYLFTDYKSNNLFSVII